jgi:hypothetical protein
VGSYKHGNELFGSIKGEKFVDYLSDYSPLEDSAPRSWLLNQHLDTSVQAELRKPFMAALSGRSPESPDNHHYSCWLVRHRDSVRNWKETAGRCINVASGSPREDDVGSHSGQA